MDTFILKSSFEDFPISDQDLATQIWDCLEKYEDKVALIEAVTEDQYTFKKLKEEAECLASHLLEMGVKPRDIVALYSSNCLEFVVMQLAVWRLGGTVALISPMATANDLKKEIARLDLTILFTNDVNIERAVTGSKDTAIKVIISTVEYEGCISYQSLVSSSSSVKLPIIADMKLKPKEDTAAIFFSSGTTGPPKAVQLTHDNANCCITILRYLELGLENKSLTFQPLSHGYGAAVTMLMIFTGNPNIIVPRFIPELYCQLVEKHQIRVITLVPPAAVILAKSGLLTKYDLSCVDTIVNSAAPLSMDIVDEFSQQLGKPIAVRQIYGMTESCGLPICTPVEGTLEKKPVHDRSIGVLWPHFHAKVTDLESGKSLGPHEKGELCFRGRPIMKGYLGDAGATAASIDDEGWLHTGDIGYYDENQYFYVVDRLKELIKYNALQVSPSELESFIMTHPSVADVGVVGKPDEVHGQLPMAWVVKKKGAELTEEDIVKFVADNVAPHKKLRGGVKLVDVIPKSPSGKILRREILRTTLESDN